MFNVFTQGYTNVQSMCVKTKTGNHHRMGLFICLIIE